MKFEEMSLEELRELASKSFTLICQSEPVNYPPGSTIWIRSQKVRCPACGNIFEQVVKSGCFTVIEIPLNCPRCGFRESVLREISKRLMEKRGEA